MVRPVVAALFLAAAGAALADDKDPVRDKLAAARAAYDNEMKQVQKQTGDWLDKREAAARKAGDKKLLDQVKDERKAFTEGEEMPRAAPAALRQKPAAARKAMDAAYAEAVKAYTKAKRDEEAAAVEAAWKAFAAETTIDLLALVDPKAHAVAGGWKKDGPALVNNSTERFSRLELPYEPGAEYDVELTCRRLTGGDCIAVGLVAGDRQLLAVIDGWPPRGYATCFDTVDKKRGVDNLTAVKGDRLKNDKDYTIACSVRDGKLDLSVNGKPVTSFKGEFNRLGIRDGHGVPNPKALFLFIGPDTTFRIDQLVVKVVNGRGTVLK
jgi:hypothetical protein